MTEPARIEPEPAENSPNLDASGEKAPEKSGADSGVPMRIMPHGGALQSGNPKATGRKPSWFVKRLEAALRHSKAPDVLSEIIAGQIREQVGVDRKGEPIYAETKNADRIAAIKLAAAYTEGLPVARVEDVTPPGEGEVDAAALLQAIPRILNAMPHDDGLKARIANAIEADFEVVD